MSMYLSVSPTWMQSLALVCDDAKTTPANVWQPWYEMADMRKVVLLMNLARLLCPRTRWE